MNAGAGRRHAVDPGRRDRRARAAPRDRPPAHRPLRGRSPAAARWRRPWRTSRRASGPMRGRLLDRFGEEFPGHGPDARARRRSPRGAAADPGRQREPGRRAAARAGRRPPARARDPLPRRHRAASRPRSPTARRSARTAARCIELLRDAGPPRADLAGRPAALHPRALGRAPRATALDGRSSPGSTWPSASWPRRSAALHLRFGGGPAAGGPAEAPSFAGADDEPEAFSSDSAWMPRRRADRQEHLRLARPAVAALRPRHPHARRDPRRGARHARPAGASPGCG